MLLRLEQQQKLTRKFGYNNADYWDSKKVAMYALYMATFVLLLHFEIS